MVSDNLKNVTQRIARCCEKCGRHPGDVSLICVTKEASVEASKEALAGGARFLGENRVQSAISKYRIIGDGASWHLIGHLQTNKAKEAVRIFSLIHSVDSAHLAGAINKEAVKIGKVQDVLVQVNVAGEESKFGVSPEKAKDLISELAQFKNIRLQGLMTIAPLVDDPERVRPYFRALRELRDHLNDKRYTINDIRHLSMGMTDDFEVAIEEGSTMVRIGRAIFGNR